MDDCRLFLKSPCGKGRVCGRTSLRRDEGVDEHPQPKNNAGIATHSPGLELTTRASGTNQN